MDSSPSLDVLGRNIREQRTSLGLTQEQLACRLGWSQERISTIERGRYGMPSIPALSRLADALQVPFVTLIEASGYVAMTAPSSPPEDQASDVALRYALQRLLAIDAISLGEALNQASDVMVQAMGADKIDAFIYQPESESLVAVGSSDTPMGRRQHELGLDREPLANGGRNVDVYKSNRSYYTSQADQDPGMLRGVVEALGVRSFFGVPLRVEGNVIGVLSAQSAQPERYSRDDRQFFEAAARWVALVARRAELSESLTRIAVAEARRMAAEEIVTLIAHDLGNALTPVKGRLDIVRHRIARENRGTDLEDVEIAIRSLERVQRMVGELLDVARIDEGIFALSTQTVDLCRVLQELVAGFRTVHEDITLQMPKELRVPADRDRLTQVLENLLANAVKHGPFGMPIIVDAVIEEDGDGRWAVVRVQDAGPGIPRAQAAEIFTRFATGPQSNGLGIGLYLAQRIAQEHGGTLTVDLAVASGTSFRLALPLAPEGAASGN